MPSHVDSPPIPSLPLETVERSAVLRSWLPQRHKLCHLVLGPAGSGKTALALQWRSRLVELGFKVAWLSCHPNDGLETLGPHLLAAFDTIAMQTSLGTTIETAANEWVTDPPSPSAMAAALIGRVAASAHDTMLVVDDYQHAAHLQAQELFQTLLDHAPPNLHLLFVSRIEPTLSLMRLQALGELYRIDWPDLKFSTDEVEALAHRHAPQLDNDQVNRLHAQTQGWAVGLRMQMRAFARRTGKPHEQKSVRIARPLALYLQREIFFCLAPNELHALVRLSPTRRFNEALASKVLGAESSQQLIALLRRHRMFVTSETIEGDDSWWRFHPMLRTLLQDRFASMPFEQQRRTRIQLGEWLGRRGMLRDAVELLVSAGEASTAADWIEQQAEELFFQGHLQCLLSAMQALPPNLAAGRPALTTWLAWMHLASRQFDACMRNIARLEGSRGEEAGAPRQALTCLLRALVAAQMDDLAAAQAALPQLFEMHAMQQPVLLGGRRLVLAWYFLHQGMFEETHGLLQGPAHHLPDGRVLRDSPFGTFMAQVLHGMTWLHQGQYRQAESLLRDTYSNACRSLGPDCLAAHGAAALLAEVLIETGDPDGARKLLGRHGHAVERSGVPDMMLSAAVARSRLAVRDGSPSTALAALEHALRDAKAHNMRRLEAALLHERFDIALRTKDDIQAQRDLDALEAVAERALRDYHPAAARIAQWAGLSRARWHAHRLRDEQALNEVQGLESQAVLSGWLRVQTGALMAILMRRGGKSSISMQQTLQVVQLAQGAGMLQSVIDLGPAFLQMLSELQRNDLIRNDAMLGLYLQKLLRISSAQGNQVTPGVAASAAAPAMSARELQILNLLTQDLPNRRIGDALGVSTETIRWHLKNIFSKLGVGRRNDAVMAARQLGLDGVAPFQAS